MTQQPNQILLNEIFQVIERSIAPVDCVKPSPTCQRVDSCLTRNLWATLKRAIDGVLNSTTLQDLIDGKLNSQNKFSTKIVG